MRWRGPRRGTLAGVLGVTVLSWTSVRVAAPELEARGQQAFWRGDFSEALSRFQTILQMDPNNLAARQREIEIYLSALESPSSQLAEMGLDSHREVGERCGRALSHLVAIAPLLPETWAAASDFYAALKPENQRHRTYSLEEISARAEENLEPEDVLLIRALEVATQVDPSGVYYWDTLGDRAYEIGLRNLALESYREAVVLYPDQTKHVFLEAVPLDPEVAQATVEGMSQALGPRRRADPETVNRNLGIFLLGLGRFEEAREAFRRAEAVAIDGGNYIAWQAYAEASRGNDEEAILLYRRSLSHDRLGPDEKFRNHLYLGELLEKVGRHAEAIRELRSALTLQPREPRALLLLGRIYESAGMLAEAEEQFVRASESRAERIRLLVNLVEFYRRNRRPVEALIPARKLMELEPNETVYQKQVEQLQAEIGEGALP